MGFVRIDCKNRRDRRPRLSVFQTAVADPTPRAVILSGEPIWDALWFRGTLLTKLSVVYSLALFGSESKPEERGTSDEGASGNARADLLDTRTVQVVKNTDQRDFYRNIIGLNRLLLKLIVQPKRSDPKGRPAPQAAWVSTSRTV